MIHWSLRVHVDACHSGSALAEGRSWVRDQGGKLLKQFDTRTYKECELAYFVDKCDLEC